MKKMHFLIGFMALGMLCNVVACMAVDYGFNYHKDENLEHIEHIGCTFIEDTTVAGRVKVNGSIETKKTIMGELCVNGQASLYESCVNATTLVNGFISAVNSNLQELIVGSQKINLSNCIVKSVLVKKIATADGIQTLDLRSSTINGSVVFESGAGIILLSSDSQIDGQIIGAKVIKE